VKSHSTEYGDHDVRLQWTLLYENRDGNWVFARGLPDAESPPNAVKQIAGITDVAWSGRDNSGPHDPESSLLSFPLVEGKTWQSHFTRPDGPDVRCEHHALGWESVTTPAGTFDALRIGYRWPVAHDGSANSAPRDEVLSAVRWYAPIVQNFVREQIQFPSGGNALFELQQLSIAK